MAKYHVGGGMFSIYAGILKKNGIEWLHKNDVKDEALSAVAQPERKRGEWIRNDNGTYSCSVCQSWIPEQQHCYARYCLYCGADMRGD